jgi:hypothetical protein
MDAAAAVINHPYEGSSVHHRTYEHMPVILPEYECPDKIPDKGNDDQNHYEKHNIGN